MSEEIGADKNHARDRDPAGVVHIGDIIRQLYTERSWPPPAPRLTPTESLVRFILSGDSPSVCRSANRFGISMTVSASSSEMSHKVVCMTRGDDEQHDDDLDYHGRAVKGDIQRAEAGTKGWVAGPLCARGLTTEPRLP